MFDLRIANRSIARFAEHVGFSLPSKQAKLEHLLATRRLNETKETVRLVGARRRRRRAHLQPERAAQPLVHREWDNRA